MALTAKGQPGGLATLDADGNLDQTISPGEAVDDQAALTAAAAAGSTPTKAEFDKVVADAVAARTTLNALLASLRAVGVIAS